MKYELTQLQYKDANRAVWVENNSPTLPIKVTPFTTVQGVALVQMTAAQTLTFEAFPGKTADQVSGFDSKAVS